MSSEYKAILSMPHVQTNSITVRTTVELVWQGLVDLAQEVEQATKVRPCRWFKSNSLRPKRKSLKNTKV